jgi:hypothetical protein
MGDRLIHRMVVDTITPEAWLAITEAAFKYNFSHWSFQNSRRVEDEWHIAFRAKATGKAWRVEHVAFFELLDGTICSATGC